MRSPSTLKEVLQLTGYIATSKFLAKLAERAHSFFCLLKKQVNFEWKKEYEKAFQDLKRFLMEAPMLSKPRDGELLYIYLLVTEKAISSILVREKKKQQRPVYYVNKAL